MENITGNKPNKSNILKEENNTNPDKTEDSLYNRKDKIPFFNLNIEINERGMNGVDIKDQLKQFYNKSIDILCITVHFNSILEINSVFRHSKCFLLSILDELSISIDTVDLSFPSYEYMLSRSSVSIQCLNESELKVIDSFIEFISYNLLFLHSYRSYTNTFIKKILFNKKSILFTNCSSLDLMIVNGVFLKKSIFSINNFDLTLIDNMPPNYWDLCINLFKDTINNNEKLFSRTQKIITHNIHNLSEIIEYNSFNMKRESYIIPGILISFEGEFDVKFVPDNSERNNVAYFYKYIERVRERYSNIVVNMVLDIPSSDKIQLLEDFLMNSFGKFKGLLLILKKENDKYINKSSLNLAKDCSAIVSLIRLPFNFIRVLYLDENRNILFEYKKNRETIVHLIIGFKASKTSRLRSSRIKRSTIILVKDFIY